MTKVKTLTVILVSLLLITPSAQAVMVTFDEPVFTHGTVVSDQYDTAAFGNLTISGFNKDNDFEFAVAFDSDLNNTRDNDLEAPFSNVKHPELGVSEPGNILIVQENDWGCLDDTCDYPDDEGSRPAGVLSFQFEQAIDLISLDFFDIENVVDVNDENSGRTGTEINFFDEFGNDISASFASLYTVPGTGGDNTWDRLYFAGITGIYGIEVNLYGSGAIDNLEYSVVPVPAAVWLFGTALIGLVGFARRKQQSGIPVSS